jgi:hypothetical protein
MNMPMRHLGVAIVMLVLGTGCSLFRGGEPPVEAVSSPEVAEFARSIQPFYDALENRPLDTAQTYENPKLRSFFQTTEGFAAYYAQLAGSMRAALFRNSTAQQIDIVNLSLESADRAKVDIEVVGRHERQLRRGELRIPRTDTWIRVDGRWVIAPEKL